ncbi:MAG: hypothetical protein AAFO77_15275 [Pseudomonadota bacterium]
MINQESKRDKMQDFQWIVGVCDDLATFAEKNGLTETTRAAQSAAKIASLEIKLAECLTGKPPIQRLSVSLPGQKLRMGYSEAAGKAVSSMATPGKDEHVVVSRQSRK